MARHAGLLAFEIWALWCWHQVIFSEENRFWGCVLRTWGNNCGLKMTHWLLPMCRKWPERLNPPFSSFRVNTEWLHQALFRLEVEVASLACGVQRGRKRSELRKQHELEDTIWQIQSCSAVKATFFSSISLNSVSYSSLCHVKNLTSPDTQNQQ